MKYIYGVMIIFICVVYMNGCSIETYDETKEKDVDYTILSEEEIPEQVDKIIEESKNKNFRKTYSDGDYLYMIIGYGAQPTSSYSIEVQEIYESTNAIYITTMLKGPSKAETVLEVETYPYVVVKVQYTDKAVVFQ